MKSDIFDVIVIGAGPAGIEACLRCTRRGFKTVIIDKSFRIAGAVRCGELMNSASLSDLGYSDESWIRLKLHKYSIHGPFDSGGTIAKHEIGAVINRRMYSEQTLRKAISAGAVVLTSAKAVAIENGSDGFHNIKIRHDREYIKIIAKVIIAADGWRSSTASLHRIKRLNTVTHRCLCLANMINHKKINKDSCRIYLDGRLAPGGYAWVIPHGNGTGQIGLGASLNLISAFQLRENFRMFRNHLFADAEYLSSMGGVVPCSPLESIFSSRGILFAGDAAGQTNPLTGSGVYSAMKAGRLCADVAADAISEGDWSAGRLRRYDDLWRIHFGDIHNSNYDTRQKLNSLDNVAVDFGVRRFFEKRGEPDSVSRVLSEIMQFAKMYQFNEEMIIAQ